MGNFKVEYLNGLNQIRIGSPARGEGVGTPVTALSFLDNGRLSPGWYDLHFDTVVPGVSAHCTVVPPSPNYQRHWGRALTVPLDGTPVKNDVIEGCWVSFNPSVSFISSWWVRLYAGAFFGSHYAGNPLGITRDETAGPWLPDDPLNVGAILTGQGAGANVHIGYWKVTNLTDKTSFETFAKRVPHGAYKALTGDGLDHCFNTANDCDTTRFDPANGEKPIPFDVTFDNDTGTTIGMRIDGDYIPELVVNLSTNATGSSSALVKGTKYRIDDGPLKGFEIRAPLTAEDGDHGEIYVTPVRFTEITPIADDEPVARLDDGIEDGTLWGYSPVGLTELDQAVRTVTSLGAAFVATKTVLAAGAAYAANPHDAGFIVTGGLSLSAGL